MDCISPDELLVRIFSLLSDSPRSIAACRATCCTFERCSTQFLIPRVVFARRLNVLESLWGILELKNVRILNGVVELLFDASSYQQMCARRFESYSHDITYEHERNLGLYRPTPRDERYTALLNRAGMSSAALWEEVSYQFDEESDDSFDVDEEADPALDVDKSLVARGYADYMDKREDQTKIRRDGFDIATLEIVFRRFARLRRIAFTDFRGLAMHKEDYNSLCHAIGCLVLMTVAIMDV